MAATIFILIFLYENLIPVFSLEKLIKKNKEQKIFYSNNRVEDFRLKKYDQENSVLKNRVEFFVLKNFN